MVTEDTVYRNILKGKQINIEDALHLLHWESTNEGWIYTGPATGLQFVMAFHGIYNEAFWRNVGMNLQMTGKVNMGNICKRYFRIKARGRNKQAIILWGCCKAMNQEFGEHTPVGFDNWKDFDLRDGKIYSVGHIQTMEDEEE